MRACKTLPRPKARGREDGGEEWGKGWGRKDERERREMYSWGRKYDSRRASATSPPPVTTYYHPDAPPSIATDMRLYL